VLPIHSHQPPVHVSRQTFAIDSDYIEPA